MKNKPLNLGIASIFGLALVTLVSVSCNNDDENDMMTVATAPDVNFTALASNNTILTYNARNLATSTSSTAIVGFQLQKTL